MLQMKQIIFFTLLFSIKFVHAEELTLHAPKSKLIDDFLSESDECVLGCMEKKKSPLRLRALMGLEIADQRVEDRFLGLQKWIVENPNADKEKFATVLNSFFAETRTELKTTLNASTKDLVLNAYLKSESSRLLAETAMRLGIAGAMMPASLDKFRAEARTAIDYGFNSLKALNQKKRDSEAPTALARLARTELSLSQLENMYDSKKKILTEAFDQIEPTLKKYRTIQGPKSESHELDLVYLESSLMLHSYNIGDMGGNVYISDTRINKIDALKSSIDKSINESKDPRYISRASHIKTISEFYEVPSQKLDEATLKLEKGLLSSDPGQRESKQLVSLELLSKLGGTALGTKVLDIAKKSAGDSEFSAKIVQYEQAEHERSIQYDKGLEKAIGKDAVKKLGLATYDELVHSNGSLKSLQEDYFLALSHLGELQAKKLKDAKSVTDESIVGSLYEIDRQWVYLQCQREQLGILPSEQVFVKAPFKSFEVDLSECKKLKGSPNINQSSILSGNMLRNIIEHKLNTDLAWIGGEFAFDVATVLASGGASELIKAPIEAGLKKVGVSLLKKEILNPTTIKGGIRATAVVANSLVDDLSLQTMSAGREFLESGIRGQWDSDILKENFAYTKKDGNSAEHATRILASAFASKGLDVLWGKARILFPSVSSKLTQNKLGAWIGSSAKEAVNLQISNTIGELASQKINKCQNPKDQSIDLLSGDKWITAIRDSILKKYKGSEMRSVRYISSTLVGRMADLNIDALSKEQLLHLQSCVIPNTDKDKPL